METSQGSGFIEPRKFSDRIWGVPGLSTGKSPSLALLTQDAMVAMVSYRGRLLNPGSDSSGYYSFSRHSVEVS